jgi:fused signal recognition particle receptor
VTTETLWIIVAVVVAVLLIAVALGVALRRQRRISLREPERLEREPGTAPPRQGGTYKAESGFAFSSGTTAPERPVDRPLPPAVPPTAPRGEPVPATPPRGQPATPDTVAPGRSGPTTPRDEAADAATAAAPERAQPGTPRTEDAPPDTAVRAPRPAGSTAAPPARPEPAGSSTAAPAVASTAAPPDTASPDTASPDTATRGGASPETAAPPAGTVPPIADLPDIAAADAGASGTVTPERPAPERPVEPSAPRATPPLTPPLPTTPYPPGTGRPDEPRSTNGVAPTVEPTTQAPTTQAPTTQAPTTQAPTARPAPPVAMPPAPAGAPAAPTEAIDPAEGRLERLRGRLARSRSGFGQGLLGLLGAGELDEESWEDVEATLLQADLGPEMTAELVETMRVELARRAVRTPAQARQMLRDVLTEALRPELDRSVRALPHSGRPAVLLVVGVNGTGKTTTTGKLARVLVAGGRHVVLGAADTFRAAAAEQLGTWGRRAGATVVRGPEGADPASVAFDAVKQAAEEGADAVLLDTAGRLHTKTGLMDELGKVKRVVSRQAEVDEVLLVLDATTGQNGLTQARVFGDVVNVSGIVLTKLDGTAKGGIVFRVQRELGVPVKLVGLGEGPDDLAPFEPAAFVDALLT